MAKSPNILLDPLAIQKAESLGLHARFIVEGYMAGEHKSPFRGFAIEFTQHREYVPGDDTRHLDWKVLGRTDRYYLKQYEQETNYVANILLDGSESMKYGSGSITKLQYGKMMAAVLSYLILHQRDAVAAGVFDTAMRGYVPRTGNLGSIHNIMKVLAEFNPTQQTSIGPVLHELAGQIRRKGMVIIISDLFDDEEKILEGIQHIRFGGSEVIVFHVMDPFELDFPFSGMVEFEGLEAIPQILTRPREIRKSYLQAVEDFRRKIREGCERNNVHYMLVNTGHALHEVISGYLAFRLKTHTR
ncbi:MAG TPA: DUF58 domain-containing protein [Tepidisphaeraceae bacterium]|jgi:uncharacterized protein (DUF58 family)|nr:DUF58 domain-containing protein [Tepidisphaeraceae bacterium]